MWNCLRVGAVLVAALAPTGCAAVADPQPGLVDELAAHDGAPCPATLPLGADPARRGLGTDEPAGARPTLLVTQAAWVCRYQPVRTGPGPDGDGSSFEWQRDGQPRAVAPTDRRSILTHVDALEPGSPSACPANLGPRWLLALSHRGDLTGVVVDDFGCGSVRLTDDLYRTAPGDPDQEGAVPGVFSAPGELLTELRSTFG